MSTVTLLLLFFLFILLHSSNSSSHPTISILTNTLKKSGDEIHIKWSNIPSPSHLDWLGIYSPPSSSHDNFIGYIFLSSSPSWESGSGNLTFPLVNLRSDYEFRIFRWTEDEIDMRFQDHDHNPLPGTAHLLLKSGLVEFEKGLGPEQVHLAYTEKNDEMRVMFVSEDGGECFVKYGVKEDLMEFTAETKVGRYEREDMCDSPANESVGWRDPGFVHDGVMVDLMKGKRYYYKVGSDSGGWSKVFTFVSRNSDSNETIGFLFGDMGTATPYSTFLRTQDESITTMKWILRDIEALGDKPSFVSHIGDISYARGYSWLWDTFFNLVEPVASRVPYHVCIGNHEYDWPSQPWKPDWSSSIYGTDGGGECGIPYSVKFNMPGKYAEPTGTRGPATRNLFYSFEKGAVHFVYISTETNFLKGSPQYHFLRHDLESVDRTKTPFVVVQGHRPMYTTSNDKKGVPLRTKMIEHLEPLFVKYKVDLALWGHVHRYERFCPLNNFTCGEFADGWPVHVVIGMAGQDWQPVWKPRDDHPNDPVFPQPKHSMYRGSEFGYTKLIATKEKLTFSYIGNHDGQVHDTLEIHATVEVENVVIKYEQPQVKDEGKVVESAFSWYVKGSSVLLLGAFMGYVLGFISHAKKEAASRKKWAPSKSNAV